MLKYNQQPDEYVNIYLAIKSNQIFYDSNSQILKVI